MSSHLVQRSDLHIRAFSTQENPRAPGADVVTTAYDRLEFPVLAKDLAHTSLERRRNALEVLRAELGSAQSFALAAQAGIGQRLLALLQDADVDIRARAARMLHVLAENVTGRRHLVTMPGGLAGIGSRMGAETDAVARMPLLRAVLSLSGEADAVDALVREDFVRLLAERVGVEAGADKAVPLAALGQLFEQAGGAAVEQAIDQGLVPLCVDLYTDAAKMVRFRAAANVAALSVPAAGKKVAAEAGGVRAMSMLLSDGSTRVTREACGALMNITVLDSAKREAVESGCLPVLVTLLEHFDAGVKLNASKALVNICAHPEGRRFLQASDAPRLLKTLCNDKDELMAESAQVLLDAVMWTP